MDDLAYLVEAAAWRRELAAAQEHARNVERIHASMVKRLEAWAAHMEAHPNRGIGLLEAEMADLSDITPIALDNLEKELDANPAPKSAFCADTLAEVRFHLHVHAKSMIAEIRRHRAAQRADAEPTSAPVLDAEDRADLQWAIDHINKTTESYDGPAGAAIGTIGRLRDGAVLPAIDQVPSADAAHVRQVVRDAVDAELDARRYKAALGVEAWKIVDAIADRVAAELAAPVSTRNPGYEPCRECRYWLGVVTEACAAYRTPVLSAHDRKVIGWIIEDCEPVHRGDLIRRTMERVLGMRQECQAATPALSAEERAILERLRNNEANAGFAIGHLGEDVKAQCAASVELLDRLLGGGR